MTKWPCFWMQLGLEIRRVTSCLNQSNAIQSEGSQNAKGKTCQEYKTCKTSLLESTTVHNPSLTSFSSEGGRSKTSYWVKSLDLGFPVATNKISRGNAVVQAICPLDTSYMRSTMSCLHTSTASVAFLARVNWTDNQLSFKHPFQQIPKRQKYDCEKSSMGWCSLKQYQQKKVYTNHPECMHICNRFNSLEKMSTQVPSLSRESLHLESQPWESWACAPSLNPWPIPWALSAKVEKGDAVQQVFKCEKIRGEWTLKASGWQRMSREQTNYIGQSSTRNSQGLL